jgi:hypothetical protein
MARLAAVLVLALVPVTAAADSRFEAFDLQTGALLFQGRTAVTQTDGTVTEDTTYVSTAGAVIQQVVVSYDPATLTLVSYRNVDLRTGETETMAVANGRVALTYRPHANADEEAKHLAWGAETAFSAAIAQLIHRAWESLRSGGTLSMELLVPSRLETVRFRIRWEADTLLSGQPVAVMRMEPATWLIRQLVDPLFFFFTRDAPHRLVEYHGRGTVKTAEGKPQDARFVYHPLPAAR